MNGKVKESIRVRYVYSACIKTTTPDLVLLHDPWFTQGIYDGSWFHFPLLESPVREVGDCDFVYVSHVHPDHYDPTFLKEYFAFYGTKPVLIADHSPNHLAKKMKADGIDATVSSEPIQVGDSTIQILPHRTGSIFDIDSALVLRYRDKASKVHCVVNTNDIIFDDEMKMLVKSVAGEIDILCCGYTGAGPFPQTYFDINDPELLVRVEEKRQAFFDRYRDLVQYMNARRNIPFAGQYLLGGKLSELNSYRGVADAVEILKFDQNAVVLSDFVGEIDSSDLLPQGIRDLPYEQEELDLRISQISESRMDYERLFSESEIGQLPMRRLLSIAASRASGKSECEIDYYFCFPLGDSGVAVVNAKKNAHQAIRFLGPDDDLPAPRSLIDIDPRYLFGLLTGVYHWNNAEVGSQFNVRRFPDQNIFAAQTFLINLSII